MDKEIDELISTALNTSLSSYYRKDALNKLGRFKKSAQLTSAIIRLLNDMEDETLQKDLMDLAVKFAVSEAVNYIIPIGVGNGRNARYALNILAKLGGQKAYKCLKDLADQPGFDLRKNAASRALHDLTSREPGLAKIFDSVSIDQVVQAVIPPAITTASVPESVTEKKQVTKPLETSSRVEEELRRDKERLRKEVDKLTKENKSLRDHNLETENHKLRTELSKLKAVYKGKFSEMSLEISDLKDRLAQVKKPFKRTIENPGQAAAKGCFGFIFSIIIMIMLIVIFMR